MRKSNILWAALSGSLQGAGRIGGLLARTDHGSQLAASHLANAGVAEEIRMKLTGHSSKAMNTRQTHLEVATLKNAMTVLPLFGSKSEAPK